MKRIRTHDFISHPPEQVWAVLADFGRYAEWNPLNLWADGEARLGARVRMRFVDGGSRDQKVLAQTVIVTACEPPRRLEWVGRVPLLFKGRHFFELEVEGAGTRLRHGEDLSGFIPMFFSADRLDRQRALYEALNRALERRVAALTSR